jgi:streptomycin 6-kinase
MKNNKSDVFATNISTIYGQKGRAWLQSLPHIVTKLSQQWKLTDLIPAPNLSYNYVLFAQQNTTHVVLKIGYDNAEVQREMAALQQYAGNGCINLLDYDKKYNALLLERAMPGVTLKHLFPKHDDQAVEYTVEVMRKLHTIPVTDSSRFPTIVNWLQGLDKAHPALDKKHILRAQELSDELLATQHDVVLLHGDLHHENILSSSRGYIAIDPKGVIGEPAYEIGAFIRNPFPDLLQQKNPAEIMHRRLALFAQLLKINQQRLLHWRLCAGSARSMLCHGGWSD